MNLLWLSVFCAIYLCSLGLETSFDVEKFSKDASVVTHALTLEDLKEFQPSVTEKNGVPTVNLDLKSPDMVLDNTPRLQNSETQEFFNTEGLEDLDFVMLHADDNDWDIRYTTALRKIAHRYLVRELLYQIRVIFKNINVSKSYCENMTNLSREKIKEKLTRIAESRRHPLKAFGKMNYTEINYLENFGLLNKYGEDQMKKIKEIKSKLKETSLVEVYWTDFFRTTFNKEDLETGHKFQFSASLLNNGALYLYCKLIGGI